MIMTKTRLAMMSLIMLTAIGISTPSSASLILDIYNSGEANPTTIDDHTLIAFDRVEGLASVDSVASPISGEVLFQRKNGTALNLDRSTAVNTDWWASAGDYNIFTTSEHWITLLLPANTYAFTFNVGANRRSSGWLQAEAYDGSVIDKTTFSGFGNSSAPGFGVYSDSSSCSAIKSITVDPTFIWGVGNFAISQGDCATSVPEPSGLILFGIGILGLVYISRRRSVI